MSENWFSIRRMLTISRYHHFSADFKRPIFKNIVEPTRVFLPMPKLTLRTHLTCLIYARSQLIRKCSNTRYNVKQGGSIYLDFPSGDVHLQIQSNWQEHCDLFISEQHQVQVDHNDTEVRITPPQFQIRGSASSSSIRINAIIPEIFDVYVNANKLQLSMKNKVMGDICVSCNSGQVVVDKARGLDLNFDIGSANLKINKLLEGNIRINCNSLEGKMINGDAVNISCKNGIAIEAMYSKRSVLNNTVGNVSLGLMQGFSFITNGSGTVNVCGIDGAFNIVNNLGDVSLQLNKLNAKNPSSAAARQGHLTARVDPSTKAALIANVTTPGNRAVRINIISESFLETTGEKQTVGVHDVLVSTPTSSLCVSPITNPGAVGITGHTRVTGVLTGKAHTALTEQKEAYSQRGKINLQVLQILFLCFVY